MNVSETKRAERYRVIARTIREMEAKLQSYVRVYPDPKRDAEIIASTKRTLDIFRKEAVLLRAEMDFEAGFK
jgi:hypothetical protein